LNGSSYIPKLLHPRYFKTKTDQTIGIPPQSGQPQAASTTPEKFGVIYKSYNYASSSAGPQKISLYDFSSNESDVIRNQNEDFDTSDSFKNWLDYNGDPILLTDYFDIDSGSMEVDVFGADMAQERKIFINKASIVPDVSSVAISPDQKEIAYCGPDGQYIVQDLFSSTTEEFTGTDICQVAYQGNVAFSQDGSAIYYEGDQVSDTLGSGISTIAYKKLTIATGKITSVGNLVTSSLFNSDHTEYLDVATNQIVVRKTDQFEDADSSNIESFPIVSFVKLPNDQQAEFQDAIFTADGKGLFYSTLSSEGKSLIGYFDLSEGKQYFPIQLPNLNIWTFQFFGALDKDTLVYGVWEAQNYSGTEAQSNNMDLYRGSVDAQPQLIDRANYFDILSFVRSK
jgi:hypothetical protein